MTKKSLKLLFFILFVFVSCSKNDLSNDSIPVSINQNDPLTAAQINVKIDESLQSQGSFNWNMASNYLLWSAIAQGQNVATIGFGNSKDDFDRTKSKNNLKIQNDILDLVVKYEGKSLDKILISADSYLNLIDVVIEKQETVIALKKSNYIRYFEPADYRYFDNTSTNEKSTLSSSGCGFESETLASEDFNLIAPSARMPWNFYKHNIPDAWNISTGSGITIGVIDTGVSPNQALLGSSFNDGNSSGRSIQKYGAYVDSFWPWSRTTDGPDDKCGHGTSMASIAVSPRNDKGLPLGVAYNANLISYRAAANVFLEGFHEHNGVKNAFTGLGNNPNVKIISLSMGYIFSVGKIEDGVRYANNRGKLIFCAAGTSTTFTTFVGVVFPAWMPETVAVTGVKEGSGYQKCDDCHTGNKVEFTIVMQRAASGNTVPVVGYYDNQSDSVGGSSVATAEVAGIAALVWSKNPFWTKDQVLSKLRQSSGLYPNRNSDFGYGNINALLAVQ